jgi:early secretory antigenic target protein ESAT-6
MNDGVLVVNFAALNQASADIQKALAKIENELNQLEQDGARLSHTWDGDAKAAYQIRQDKWRAAATDLSTILRDIKAALDESAGDYMSTEKKAASLFQ